MRRVMRILFLLMVAVYFWSPISWGSDHIESRVYFITPQDGDTLDSPFIVRFGLRGMGVAPAGVQLPDTGHHHLLIDTEVPALDKPIIQDERHRHFGKGQTETELSLSPGKHTLQLLFGDFAHRPHQKPLLSEPIVVHVR